jgi:two-component system cell cycle sensor histidine kinase/response regulator CckA
MKPPSEKRGTVLVIEDEPAVREVSRAMLERLGYRTLEAKTGGEAISLAETYDGDIGLALLDIGLPDMTGNEVYRMISKVRPGMKVIVCSGYALEGAAEEILNAGAHSFIQKPYSISHLSGSLSEVMGQSPS